MSPRTLTSVAVLAFTGVMLGCDGHQVLAPSISPDDRPALAQGGSALPEPTNATAVAISSTEVRVGWRDNSGNETRFEIQLSITGETGPFSLRATAGANTVSSTDGGLSPVTRYCYRVRAVRVERGSNKITNSAFSNVACAITPAAPVALLAAPSDLTATRSAVTRVDVTWNGRAQSATGYYVHRSVDDGATWVTMLTANGYAPTTPPPYPMNFSDLAAPASLRACYRAVAFNATIESAPSAMVCADPLPTQPPAQVPAAASNVTAFPVNSSSVNVNWNGNSAAVTTYRAYRSTDNGATWNLFHTNTWDYTGYGLPYLLTAVDNLAMSEESVCYRVIASNSVGDAPPSAMGCTNLVLTPTNLMIARLDAATVEMHWTDASSVEDSYEIWGTVSTPYWCDGACNGDVGFGDFLIATLPANSTSYRCTNCTVPYGDPADANYLIRMSVVAVKGALKSYMNTVSVP
jgi:titin